jgi:WhiB family redox-sensing transcriptional regulator
MTFPLFNGEPWTADALCAQIDPEIFYAEKGQSDVVNLAKRVCRHCPVRGEKLGGTGECLDYALKREERFGVWGGYSERERRRMIQRRREGAA